MVPFFISDKVLYRIDIKTVNVKSFIYRTEINFILYGLRPARVWRENSSSRSQEKWSSANAKSNKKKEKGIEVVIMKRSR